MTLPPNDTVIVVVPTYLWGMTVLYWSIYSNPTIGSDKQGTTTTAVDIGRKKKTYRWRGSSACDVFIHQTVHPND